MELPLRVVLGKVLVLRPGGDDSDFLEDLHAWRHELLRTELDPAFASICYYVSLSVLDAEFQHLLGYFLQYRELLVNLITDSSVRIEHTGWIYETGAQYCIVPVEYDHCFVHLGLLRRSQPHSIIGQARQVIPPYLIKWFLMLRELELVVGYGDRLLLWVAFSLSFILYYALA